MLTVPAKTASPFPLIANTANKLGFSQTVCIKCSTDYESVTCDKVIVTQSAHKEQVDCSTQLSVVGTSPPTPTVLSYNAKPLLIQAISSTVEKG